MSIRAYITSRSLPEAVSSHRSISGRPAAAHRHPDCKHFFFVLDGEGILRADDDELKLSAGDVVMLEENEVHWFENRSDANFEFIELWVPAPPTPTVWVSDDQCTWALNES